MAFYRILRGVHGRSVTKEEREQTGEQYVNKFKGDIIERDHRDPRTIEDVRTKRLELVSEGGPLLEQSMAQETTGKATKKGK